MTSGKTWLTLSSPNNGYTVYNLGIKQPIADILRAAKEKNAARGGQ